MRPMHILLRPLAILALCLSTLWISCDLARAQDAPAPAATTIEIGDEVTADAQIRARIQTIFREIEGLSSIRVSVAAGVVTLSGQVEEAVLAERAEELAARVSGVVAIENELTEQTAVAERLRPVLSRFEKRLRQALDYLPLLMVAGLVWLMIGLLGWFVTTRNQPWNWLTPNAFIADLLRQTVWLVFLMLGALVALDILGATAVLGTVIGAVGIIGLAIGFAVKDTVENYIASILLSVRQPFQPRDFIALEGVEGFVIRLTSRATILMDVDGNHIRIPNAAVFKANIVNYTRNPERRFSFELGIDAASPLREALAVCHDTLEGLDFVLDDPEPGAWIEKVGDSNVILGLSGWINQAETDFVKARSEAIRSVKTALEAAGFALPEPTYRVLLDAEELAAMTATSPSAKKPRTGGKPAAKPAAPVTPPPSSVEEATDTGVDEAVLKKVDDERQSQPDADLLSSNGKDELGARPVT